MNTAYEENGKKVTYKGPKTGKKNIISSVYSQQFAKSIICGGELITGEDRNSTRLNTSHFAESRMPSSA